MKCIDVKNNLYFYITGELEPEAVEDMRAHLAECRMCNALHAEFCKTLELTEQVRHTFIPECKPGLAACVIEKLGRQNSAALRFRLAAAVSFCMLLFVSGYEIYKTRTSPAQFAMTETENLAYYLTDFSMPELYESGW